MKFSKCLFIVIIVVSIIGCKICSGNSDIEVISENSHIFIEIMPVAKSWKGAVLNKDIDLLLSFALPEDAKYVSDNLRNNHSRMFKMFFKSKYDNQNKRYCIYDILNNAIALKIAITKHKSLDKWGNGVSVYYYDSNKINPKFPLHDKEIIRLTNKGLLISIFFFKTDGRWYTSYDF